MSKDLRDGTEQADSRLGPDPHAPPLCVLCWVASTTDSQPIRQNLSRMPQPVDLGFVHDEEAFRDRLTDPPDIVLAEYELPDLPPGRALDIVRATFASLPFIFICAQNAHDVLTERCLLNEIDNYIPHESFDNLPAIVNQALRQRGFEQSEQATAEILKRREAILAGVCSVASDLLLASHWEDAIGKTITDLGLAAQARSLTIFRNESNEHVGLVAVPVSSWHHFSVNPREVFSFNFSYEHLSNQLKTLLAGEVVHLAASQLPAHADALARIDIDELVLVPVLTHQHLWGVMALSPQPPNESWLPSELNAFKAAANIFAASVLRDETREALHLSEESLRQSQKMEALGLLAGGVAHDFNNMLTSILGYARLIRTKVQDHEVAPDVEEIIAAGERAAVLARRLLLFGRKHVSHREYLNLTHVVKSVANMLTRVLGEDIILRIDCETPVPEIFADKGHVEQLILNFCVNARDAMPKGGELHIGTRHRELDEAFCQEHTPTLIPGTHIELIIRDTGPGISEDMREKIFEPFFTTKELGKGTGLGLSTCLKIMQEYAADFVLESDLGEGTTFRIFFPASIPDETEKVDDTQPWDDQYKGSECIMIIEDEEVVVRMAERTLRAAGYRVFSATNGRQAVELAKALEYSIDLFSGGRGHARTQRPRGCAAAARNRPDKGKSTVHVWLQRINYQQSRYR